MRTCVSLLLFFLISANMQVLSLHVKPQNQVVVGNAILNCTSSRSIGVTWLFKNLTESSPCFLYKTNASTGSYKDCMESSKFSTRFAVRPYSSGRITVYNLVISNMRPTDAGTYVCVEQNVRGEKAAAVLGVLGGATRVNSNQCVHVGELFSAYVYKTYYGSSVLPLMMTWTTSDNTVVNSTLQVMPKGRPISFKSTITVPANPAIPSYFTCTTRFGRPTSAIRGTTQATNAPDYVFNVTRPVIFMPRIDEVDITDADGAPVTNDSMVPVNSTLICSTPVRLRYTFYWTNVYKKRSGVVRGNTLILRDIGPFHYQCNIERGITSGKSRCSTSRTIKGTVSSLASASTVNDDIQPTTHLITGGTTVFVTLDSQRFMNYSRRAEAAKFSNRTANVSDSGANAELLIKMVYSKLIAGNATTKYKSIPIAPVANASDSNVTVLTFVLPVFPLPGEFANYTDPSLVFPFNNASSERRARSLSDAKILQHFAKTEVEKPARRFRRSVSSVSPETNSTLAFYVYLRLHGHFIYPWNLSDQLRFINLLPLIHDTGEQTFSSNKFVQIRGKYLNRGVTLATDYTVTVGNGNCTPVGELSYNLLTCRAPASEPNHTAVDASFCSDNYAILVSVSRGTVSLGIAGCLRYSTDEFPSLLYIIIAAAAAGLLLLLLVILLSVARARRNRRKDRRSRDTRQSADSPSRSHFARPSVPANSLQTERTPDTTKGKGGYCRHLSVVAENDGYLDPNPALDLR